MEKICKSNRIKYSIFQAFVDYEFGKVLVKFKILMKKELELQIIIFITMIKGFKYILMPI